MSWESTVRLESEFGLTVHVPDAASRTAVHEIIYSEIFDTTQQKSDSVSELE